MVLYIISYILIALSGYDCRWCVIIGRRSKEEVSDSIYQGFLSKRKRIC